MNALVRSPSVDRPLEVVPLASANVQDRAQWDQFVQAHPDGTFFHLAGWQTVIERAFGHETQYLFARAGSTMLGVLPLARVRSRWFGDALVSTPFCVYGGVLAATPEAGVALAEHACELARSMRVDYLELRNRTRMHPDWPCRELYVTFRKSISSDTQANLNAIPRKQRASVRKAISLGLGSTLDSDVEPFYGLYSESLRNLGTPVFSRRFVQVLRDVFADKCEIQSVSINDESLASVLSFYFRDEVLPYYGGGTSRAREYSANDFMYWEVMRRAAERGLRVFDFGRSKRDSGSYKFKVHWGFEAQPLHYEYFLVGAKQLPDLSPNNPRYRALIGVWKRMPLWATQALGPRVARYLG